MCLSGALRAEVECEGEGLLNLRDVVIFPFFIKEKQMTVQNQCVNSKSELLKKLLTVKDKKKLKSSKSSI